MADVSKTVSIIFQGQDSGAEAAAAKVAAGLDKVEAAAKGATAGSDLWQDSAGKWRNSLGQFATDSEKAAAGIDSVGRSAKDSSVTVRDMASAMAALAGSIVVKEFVNANVSIENFGRSMALVTGSTQGAAQSLEYVRSISDTLGLEISGTADNFVSLSAAAKGTALEGQATRDIFEAISKSMALLGKSSADTNGALLAVQQIISKGTVSAEELRGQLGERLPGAFQIAARAMGLTTAELGKFLESGSLTAEQFLPAFAAELNKTFGDTKYVTTFNAELNRLVNSFKELAVAGGDSGIFALLIEGLRDVTTITKTTAVEISAIGGVFNALRTYLAGGGRDTEAFVAALRKVGVDSGIANSAITNANESVAEWSRLVRQAATDGVDWSKAINQSAAESKRLGLDGASDVEALAQAYKDLGLNATQEVDKYVKGLEALVKSTESTAEEISSAFKIVIPKISNVEELERFSASAAKAATDGKISWEQWAVQVDKASESFLKNTGYVKDGTETIKAQSEELKKNEEAARKAQEAAEKMALEYEKIASNERIKNIEFKVELDIARLEADTKRVEAAFDSINNTMNSTGAVISSALSMLKDFDSLDWGSIRIIEDQLAKENEIRRENFELQKRITEAQIRSLNAQTAQLEKGDAMIKIDGAGLQPHLEAFMFEILKAIQVRVNRDGLPFLLGT